MRKIYKAIVITFASIIITTRVAEAKHYHHSHAHSFGHFHITHHRASRTVHHLAHYTASYAVHYSIRKAVRHALAPDHPLPNYAAPGTHDSEILTPANAQPVRIVANDIPHAGPRLGFKLFPNEMRVDVVDAGSPAYLAGLDQNDIITKVGGNRVKTSDDIVKAIQDATPSGTLKLSILRDGKEYNATIPLAPAPSQ
jgi:hypothetical protein